MTYRHLVVAAIAATAFMAVSATAEAADKTLRYNNWLPVKHNINTDIMQPWFDDIAKVTGGRIAVEWTASSLGPPPRQFDLANDGVADIVMGVHGYTPARFVLTSIIELPFNSNSGEALSGAYWKVHEQYFAQANEHKGVKLLGLFTHGPGQIWHRNKQIGGIGEMRGEKFRIGPGFQREAAKALGLVMVTKSAIYMQELLQNGVVDGTFLPQMSIPNFKLESLLRHMTKVPGGFYNESFFLAMSQKTWDTIAKKDQDAIMSVSGYKLSRHAGKTWDDRDTLATPLLKKAGISVQTASDSFMADLKSKIGHLPQEWVKRASDKRGIDGAAAIKVLHDEIGKIETSM
jgi:TRAP-type C4-dicarboxylate transport system substrate-binding protein